MLGRRHSSHVLSGLVLGDPKLPNPERSRWSLLMEPTTISIIVAIISNFDRFFHEPAQKLPAAVAPPPTANKRAKELVSFHV
ncbi:hypothetical protein C5167_014473 [Papaver somniferum]|uniref:Uncharacterized protein n=1 Tax=Papaver somniferum TaxID=3469 RepID=A0A4Y7J487_PAPSO|nr:hypothetical protein C5167_014473 [Papaver somniferum]